MERYHSIFFITIFIILILIILMSLNIIHIKNKVFILIDTIFKFLFGIFIIIFFIFNKYDNLKKYDRLLIILSGFVLLILIDYIKIINILFYTPINDDKDYIINE